MVKSAVPVFEWLIILFRGKRCKLSYNLRDLNPKSTFNQDAIYSCSNQCPFSLNVCWITYGTCL